MAKEDEDQDLEFTAKPSSFKEIVMDHLRRITLLSSCELRGGYYSTVTSKTGDEKEIYVEDSREALSNAIYCLAHLLLSKHDKEMKPKFEEFEKELKEQKEKFLKGTKIKDNEVLGEAHYKDQERIMLEEYKIKKMRIFRQLFAELCNLLSRLKYFEIGGGVY